MSKLKEILQAYGEGVDSQGWYEGFEDAERRLLAWVDEVIGEDEKLMPADPYQKRSLEIRRNELRAEQRKRARS